MSLRKSFSFFVLLTNYSLSNMNTMLSISLSFEQSFVVPSRVVHTIARLAEVSPERFIRIFRKQCFQPKQIKFFSDGQLRNLSNRIGSTSKATTITSIR